MYCVCKEYRDLCNKRFNLTDEEKVKFDEYEKYIEKENKK